MENLITLEESVELISKSWELDEENCNLSHPPTYEYVSTILNLYYE